MNKLKDKPSIKQRKNSSYQRKIATTYNSSLSNIEAISVTTRTYHPKARSRKNKKNRETILSYGMGCIVIGGIMGLFSSLLGHTLLEQTRRDQIRIKEKIITFKSEIGFLKNKIDDVKYHENIDRWAESRGMINDRVSQPKAENTLIPSNPVLQDAYVASF